MRSLTLLLVVVAMAACGGDEPAWDSAVRGHWQIQFQNGCGNDITLDIDVTPTLDGQTRGYAVAVDGVDRCEWTDDTAMSGEVAIRCGTGFDPDFYVTLLSDTSGDGATSAVWRDGVCPDVTSAQVTVLEHVQ